MFSEWDSDAEHIQQRQVGRVEGKNLRSDRLVGDHKDQKSVKAMEVWNYVKVSVDKAGGGGVSELEMNT